jgi:hypothetical protein
MLVMLLLPYALASGSQLPPVNRASKTTALGPYVPRYAHVVKAENQSPTVAHANNTRQSQLSIVENGTDDQIQQFIERAEYLADLALKDMNIRELATTLDGTLSDALDFVGPLANTLMSRVGMFLTPEDSTELTSIKGLWKFVAERFKELEEKIHNAVKELEAHNVMIDWQEVGRQEY